MLIEEKVRSASRKDKAGEKSGVTRVVIITGLAGAGKSTALKAFEDMGFEAVDNLPITLLNRLLSTPDVGVDHPGERPLAIGIDCRTRGFQVQSVIDELARLKKRDNLDLELLFFDCDDQTLTERFSETRRKHPMALDRPIADGIAREREIMAPLRAWAKYIFDTTGHTVHDLRERLRVGYMLHDSPALSISTTSFGFSRGLPRNADLVFDVRFLRNPHYDPSLRPLTGRDEDVAAFIATDANFSSYVEKLMDQLRFLLPLYAAEGKSYLTIAFGCTGGRHRSVFLAELIGRTLEKEGFPVTIVHRDS